MILHIAFDQESGGWGVHNGESAWSYNKKFNCLEPNHAPLDFWLRSCEIHKFKVIQIEVEEFTIEAIFKALPELAL